MTIDIFDEMLEDAAKAPVIPTDENLQGVAKLVQEQIILEDRIAAGEDLLKKLKKERDEIQLGKLPAALDALGLSGLPMSDGSSVIVKPFVSASISEKNREGAHGWLENNGHGDIIKRIVSVNIGRDTEAAEAAIGALVAVGLNPTSAEKVEPMTLKAFIKEQVAAGSSIPLELFGAYLGQKATIKRGK